MQTQANSLAAKLLLSVSAAGLFTLETAQAAPKVIVISLDGATPRLVDQYFANGTLPANQGLGLLQSKGFRARINETVSPSLTAVGHIAIATGSTAVKNNVVANTFHLVASPFTFNISGFGAPIGGYCTECAGGGPGPTPNPTARPIWESLRATGKKVITATWPGGDGVDVRVPGAMNNLIVEPSVDRTVAYTVPFGAFGGIGAQGFSLIGADFDVAPETTTNQLAAAGRVSFSPVRQKITPLETFVVGGSTNVMQIAALDTTDDATTNYDTLVFFSQSQGILPGPFALPSTGPAYVKASEKRSSPFYVEGSSTRAGANYYVSLLEPDLSLARISRTSANFIPRNQAVLADVDDINNNVGFWAPQPDFRIPERISPGYGPFPDIELEEIYADLVRGFTDYQARLALHAMSRVLDADLAMIYFEQPDGSGHQFLLTDPRQPTDFTNPNSIGAGQDPAKVARYASYVAFAYQTANAAVQRIIDAVGADSEGRPKSNVIVVSDHGFETFHTAVNMNNILAANGIPNNKVRAVTSGPAVNLYISLAGREPNGIVSPAEYIQLQEQVTTILENLVDTNATYTLGANSVPLFDKIYLRPLPTDTNDASFGLGTSEFIGQDSGDIHALLSVGYNFDGTQSPVVVRQGDTAVSNPVLSLPNFYGAHGYDPTLTNMSAILFAAGPDIGQGVISQARNIDIAPTIAKLLGTQLDDVDGVSLPIVRTRFPTLAGNEPLVIGHRGAAGYRPDHTLAGYQLAIEMGADFIEPDLVSTKDGILIARHEPMLGGTTDVGSRPEFADRKTTNVLDGVSTTDWFASDFTLAEIKTLRAIQPLAGRDQSFNGLYEVPTFQEVIDLAKAQSAVTGRTIGIYPETKHPTFHDSLGLSLEEPLLATLAAAGWTNSNAPVFIQSFEVSNLQELNGKTDVRLVQLIDADDVKPDGSLSLVAPYAQPYDFVVSGDPRTFADLLTPEGLAFVRTYADGVGPWKPYLLRTKIYDPNNDGNADDRNGDGTVDIRDREIVGDTGVISAAHSAGLLVHAFTFRNDASLYGFLDPISEYETYFTLGVDGLFSDFANTAVAARTKLREIGNASTIEIIAYSPTVLQLRIIAQAQKQLTIETSATLGSTASWSPVKVITPVTPVAEVAVPLPTGPTAYFRFNQP